MKLFVLFPNVLPDFLATITQPFGTFFKTLAGKNSTLSLALVTGLEEFTSFAIECRRQRRLNPKWTERIPTLEMFIWMQSQFPGKEMRLPTSLALLISKKTTNLFQNVVRIVGSRGNCSRAELHLLPPLFPVTALTNWMLFKVYKKIAAHLQFAYPEEQNVENARKERMRTRQKKNWMYSTNNLFREKDSS